MSAILHNKLNISKECMTFDISQGCSGYCHAIEIIKDIMIAKNIKSSLIFTCDLYSRIVDRDNKNVNMIFGDAATVTLLTAEEGEYSIIDSDFGTLPNSNECLTCKEGHLDMNGNQVFNYACKEVPRSIQELLNRNNIQIENVGCFLLHQGTKFMVEFIRRKLNVSEQKAKFSAVDIGNTVSSAIPIQIADIMNKNNKYKYMVLSGFGVGFTWGNILIKGKGVEDNG